MEIFGSSKFISDFNQTNWEQILYNEKSDVNFSMNGYLSKIDSLLDTHALIKRLDKKELKYLTKPWITQNSYKKYRNLLSTVFKRATEKYFTNSFNENIKDIKKTWKDIKTLVSVKPENSDTPSLITKDEKYLNYQVSIVNTFIFLNLLLKLFAQNIIK